MQNRFEVIETPMWPNRYKVESIQWPGRNNATSEFFADKGEAQKECDRRNLLAFIGEVETAHFRTNEDTGANSCAMLVWNAVRQFAELPRLTREDLAAWCVTCGKYHVNPHQRKTA